MKYKRVFLLILDSLGVGESSDAVNFGDIGANTLKHINDECELFVPNLKKIGFLNTINMSDNPNTEAYYTTAKPTNIGKDSINGHYEIMGIKNEKEYNTFNDGFKYEILRRIQEITGRNIIGNKCCYDESIIEELGERQVNYGALIVYTSGDSDIQIAAHENSISIATLHNYCNKIRQESLAKNWKIARIIARPFRGTPGKYKYIPSERKDFVTITPPKNTILDKLIEKKYDVIGIGKVNDIFDRNGINKTIKASSNIEGLNKLNDLIEKDFTGLCMANLSDFDSLYGHQRNVEGYAEAIEELDIEIPIILNKLNIDDLLIITADHGNDPTFRGNNHTRENVPVIIYSRNFKEPKRLPMFETFANIGATIADNFGLEAPEIGQSILDDLI